MMYYYFIIQIIYYQAAKLSKKYSDIAVF